MGKSAPGSPVKSSASCPDLRSALTPDLATPEANSSSAQIAGVLEIDELASRPTDLRDTDVYDPSDDIEVLVGPQEQQQRFLVSRASMCRASTIWKDWLDKHGWIKGLTTYMEFPDAVAEPLLLILRIVHFRQDELPSAEDLSFNTLLQLANLCQANGVHRQVKDFLNAIRWTSNFCPQPWWTTDRHQSWLFISLVFGHAEGFETSARYLAKAVSLDLNGKAVFDDDHGTNDFLLGPTIIGPYSRALSGTDPPNTLLATNTPTDSILNVRQQTISAMIRACHETVYEFCYGKFCKAVPQLRACDTAALGMYIEWLVAMKLPPDSENRTVCGLSVAQLQNRIIQFSDSLPRYSSRD